MRLFGHSFLRSNYKVGDPVRLTANALQVDRVADVLKNIEGLGCRVVKDGVDWLIVFDGGSDVPIPDGMVLPWRRAHASMSQTAQTLSNGYVNFVTQDHETNEDILEVDLANDKIIVHADGIYAVKLQAEIACRDDVPSAIGNGADCVVRVNTAAINCAVGNTITRTTSTVDIGLWLKASGGTDIALAEDDEIQAYTTVYEAGWGSANVRLSVALGELT